MKRFLTILMFLVSISAFSQDKLTIVSVEQNLFDISAARHPKKDVNGVAGALLRVQVPLLNDLTFKGSVLSSSHQTGEYLVYVAAGTRKLTISHPNFVPLIIDFEEFNVKIESKAVYVVRLQLPANYNTGFHVITTTQYLEFNTTPEEAIVTVNGEEWEGHRKLVPFGTYNYIITAGGYSPDSGTVVVEDPKEEVVVTSTLKSMFGSLYISDPEHKFDGAVVMVDGTTRGEMPIDPILLPEGTHQVRIRKSFYKTFTKYVDIVNGQDAIITPSLTANFRQVTLKVPDDSLAMITIDGNVMGQYEWTGNLEIGIHRIEARRDLCYPRTQEIEVSTDGNTFFSLPAPLPRYGSINFVTIPEGAEIIFDGENTHKVTPYLLTNVYVGRHSVTLKHPQAEEQSVTVDVEEGRTVTSRHMLRRKHKVTFNMNVPSAELYIDSVRKGQITSGVTMTLYDDNLYFITLKAEGYHIYRDSLDPTIPYYTATLQPLPSPKKLSKLKHYPWVGNIRVNWFTLNFELGTNWGADASLFNMRFRWFEIMPLQVGVTNPLYQIEEGFRFAYAKNNFALCYEPEIRLHIPSKEKVDWYFGGGFICPIGTIIKSDPFPGFATALPMLEGGTRPYWFIADFGFEKVGKVGTYNMFLRYNGGVALCMGFSLGTGFRKPPVPVFE